MSKPIPSSLPPGFRPARTEFPAWVQWLALFVLLLQGAFNLNGQGFGDPSQGINFPLFPDKTFGDAPFALEATATSFLPVTFTVISGPATLNGDILTLTGAGKVTVRASQAGNDQYHPAQDVDRTFTVGSPGPSLIGARVDIASFVNGALNDSQEWYAVYGVEARAGGEPEFSGWGRVDVEAHSIRYLEWNVGYADFPGFTGLQISNLNWPGYPDAYITGVDVQLIGGVGQSQGAPVPYSPSLITFGDNWVRIPNGGYGFNNFAAVINLTVSPTRVNSAQTISFDPIPDKGLNDGPFALSATASSRLPVSFTVVSGPATLNGNMLTPTGMGTVTVRAFQPGNDQYQPAAEVERTFNITTSGRVAITAETGFDIQWNGNNGGFFDAAAGAKAPNNIALQSNGSTAIGSSELNMGIHFIGNINDGLYGNAQSWIAGDAANAWVGVAFPGLTQVTSIAWGRDNGDDLEGVYKDRSVGLYTIQFTRISNPGINTPETANATTGWQSLGRVEYKPGDDGNSFSAYLRHQFELSGAGNPVEATGIRIKVSDAASAIDEIEVYASAEPAIPIITKQPAGQSFNLNGDATLSVQASGSDLTYQWQFNSQDIQGQTGRTLALSGLTPANAGSYRVLVSNAKGSTPSDNANLLFFGDLKLYAGTTLAGPVGQKFRVEYADQIEGEPGDWKELTTVTLASSPMVVIDWDSPGKPRRFYRGIALP